MDDDPIGGQIHLLDRQIRRLECPTFPQKGNQLAFDKSLQRDRFMMQTIGIFRRLVDLVGFHRLTSRSSLAGKKSGDRPRMKSGREQTE